MFVGEIVARFKADAKQAAEDIKGVVSQFKDLGAVAAKTDTVLSSSKGGAAAAAGLKQVQTAAKGLAGELTELNAAYQRSMSGSGAFGAKLEQALRDQRALVAGLRDLWKSSGGNTDVGNMLGGAVKQRDALASLSAAYKKQVTDNEHFASSLGNVTNEAQKQAGLVSSLKTAWEKPAQSLRSISETANGAKESLGRLFEISGGVLLAQGLDAVMGKVKGLAREAMDLGSRYQELDVVLTTIGKSAGVSTGLIHDQVAQLVKLGIQSSTAMDTATKFLRYGLDPASMAKLARTVQDTAVISGQTSSAALERTIYGVVTKQSEVLRTAGFQVTPDQTYAKYAQAAGKTVSALSEVEKQQALVNGLIADGSKAAGVYEASLDTASKNLRSQERYVTELKTQIGIGLQPLYKRLVFLSGDLLQALMNTFGKNSPAQIAIINFMDKISAPLDKLRDKIFSFKKTGFDISGIIGQFSKIEGVMSKFGASGAGASLALFARQLSQMGGMFGFLKPLSGWAGLIVTLVTSNKSLRSSVIGLFGDLAKAAGTITLALQPAFDALNKAMAGPEVAHFVDSLGDFVVEAGKLAAVFITALMPVFKTFVSLLTSVAGLLAEHKTLMMAVIAVWAAAFTANHIGAGLDGIQTKLIKMTASAGKMVGGFQAMWGALTNPAGAALAAVVAVGAGMALMYNKAQDRINGVKKAATDVVDTISKDQGAPAALRYAQAEAAALKDLGEQRKKTNAEIPKTKETGWEKLWDAKPFGFLPDAPGGTNQKRKDAAKVGLSDEEKAKMDANLKAVQDQAQKVVDAISNPIDTAVAKMNGYATDVKSSLETISKALGINAEDYVDYNKITTTQASQVEQKVTDLVTASQGWGKDMTSFSGALLREENMTFPKLMEHYDEMKRRTEYFWHDLMTLQKAGLDDAAIQDLIQQGPMKVGDALGTLVQSMSGQTNDWVKQQISNINDATSAIDNLNSTGTRKMAEQMLMSGGLLTANTAAEREVVVKNMQDIQKTMSDAQSQVKAGLSTISVYFTDAQAQQGQDYEAAVNNALSVMSNSASSAQQVAQSIADALDIGDKLNKNASEPAKAVLLLLQQALLAMSSGRDELYKSGQVLGIDISKGIVSTSNDSAAAGALHGLKAAQAAWETFWKAWKSASSGMKGALNLTSGGLFGMLTSDAAQRSIEDQFTKQIAAAQTAAQAAGAASPAPAVNGPRPATASSLQKAQDNAKKAQDAAQKTADAGQKAADAGQKVLDSIKPLDIWDQAVEKVMGNMQKFVQTQDDAAQGAEDFGKALFGLATSSDSDAAKMRTLRKDVAGLVQGLQAETEAAVKAGLVHEDAGSMTAYFQQKLKALRAELPGLVASLMQGTNSIISLDDQIKAVTDSLDKNLNKQIDASEATYNREDAYDKLNQRIKDQRTLLTGVMLTDKDRADIQRETSRDLNSYVKSVEDEAAALAKVGKIKPEDMVGWIKDHLKEVGQQFPELAGDVQAYTDDLKDVPKDTKTQLQLYVDAAMAELDKYTSALDKVPATYDSIINVMVNDAQLAAMQGALDGIKGDIADINDSTLQPGLGDWAPSSPEAPAGSSSTGAAPGIVGAIGSLQTGAKNLGTTLATNQAFKTGVQTLKDHAQATQDDATKQRDLATKFSDVTTGIEDQAVSMGNSGQIGKDWAAQQQFVLQRVEEEKQKYPELGGLLDDYAQNVKAIPQEQVTDVQANTLDAQGRLTGYRDIFDGVRIRTASSQTTVTANTAPALGDIHYLDQGLPTWLRPRSVSVGADISGATGSVSRLIDWLGAVGHWMVLMFSPVTAPLAIANLNYLYQHRPYDTGGPLMPGTTMAVNKTGEMEWVLNPRQMRAAQAYTGTTSMQAAITKMLSGTSGLNGSVASGTQVSVTPVATKTTSAMNQSDHPAMKAALTALTGILGANTGRGSTIIHHMAVTPNEPTKNFLEEGLWKAVNRL